MMRIVGIIGAGQMGSGIAQTVAQNGTRVLLADIDIAVAQKALSGIDKGLAKLEIALAKGKKLHDKREATAERDWQRDKARLLRDRG